MIDGKNYLLGKNTHLWRPVPFRSGEKEMKFRHPIVLRIHPTDIVISRILWNHTLCFRQNHFVENCCQILLSKKHPATMTLFTCHEMLFVSASYLVYRFAKAWRRVICPHLVLAPMSEEGIITDTIRKYPDLPFFPLVTTRGWKVVTPLPPTLHAIHGKNNVNFTL